MRTKALAMLAVLLLFAVACTSNDSDTSSGDGDTTGENTPSTDGDDADQVPTGPSPGVTDAAIKVGITFVDLEAVRQFVNVDHGDYEAAYRAVIDHINEEDIHGRQIEPVFAPISPIDAAASEAACVQLTEDEDVFAVIGFFQDDQVLCPVAQHDTAIIGGVMTDERFDQANAPWFTTAAGQDSDIEALRLLAEEGALDGNVGVFGSIFSENQHEVFLDELEALDIDVTTEAILDAPVDDLTAQNQATAVIMENFKTAGVDTILVVGSAAVPIGNGLATLDYRPQLLFTSAVAVNGYINGLDPDLSMMEGAVLGSVNNTLYDESAMQECLAIVETAVGDIPDPATLAPDAADPFISAANACRDMLLFEAIAEAAGPDLNYGSFTAAGEQLTVHLPGSEADYEFGPYPGRDGNLPMFMWDWDAAEGEFVVRED